jgi:hypothetical protein
LQDSPAAALAAYTCVDQSDGGNGSDETSEGTGPPREAREVDGHLEGKKGSHKEKAGSEDTYLGKRGGVELPSLLASLTRVDVLRVELNPASSESYGDTEDDEYPIQKSHDS